jgi:hypothetical protein
MNQQQRNGIMFHKALGDIIEYGEVLYKLETKETKEGVKKRKSIHATVEAAKKCHHDLHELTPAAEKKCTCGRHEPSKNHNFGAGREKLLEEIMEKIGAGVFNEIDQLTTGPSELGPCVMHVAALLLGAICVNVKDAESWDQFLEESVEAARVRAAGFKKEAGEAGWAGW